MFGHRVFWLGEHGDQLVFVEFLECCHYWKASDEFRDEAEADEIFRFHHLEGFGAVGFVCGCRNRGIESHGAPAESALDDFFETHEGTAADEKNLLGVDLNVFLLWVLASALGWDIADSGFENFEKGLLNAFA